MAQKTLILAGISQGYHPPGPREKQTKKNPTPRRAARPEGPLVILSFREKRGGNAVEFVGVDKEAAEAVHDNRGEALHGVLFEVTYSGRAPNLTLDSIKRA